MDTNTDTTRLTAEKVTAVMGEAGQTVRGLAEKTTIPRTTLIRRLAGRSPFTAPELYIIANALGVSIQAFILTDEDAA